MADSDTDEFSDNELYANLGDQFDITELNEDEARQLVIIVNDSAVDSDDEGDLNDENMLLVYHQRPRFEWTGGNYVHTSPLSACVQQKARTKTCD